VTTEHPGTSNADTEGTLGCTVSLYLRSSPTTVGKRRQTDIQDRLVAVAEAGRIPEPTVEQWPGQVTVNEGESAPVVTLYDELAAAASAGGARLQPFFDDREGVGGMVQGSAPDRIVTLPVASVVVRQDGDIVGLYPCHRDGIHHRVEESVDALEAGEVPANLS
jgi:hypothetical protein